MDVVGDCDAEEASSKIARLYPDIVLTGMPGIIRNLKRHLDYGHVIVLAESLDYRAEALEAGAASYLLKDVTRVELAQAIREVYRNRYLIERGDGIVEEAVELVIPPSPKAASLLRFMCQLGEIFRGDLASIICMVGSWDRGAVIVTQLRPDTSSNLMIQLANIPEVEKVEEIQPAGDDLSSFHKKLGLLSRSSISLSKRIRVTLKEAVMAGQ